MKMEQTECSETTAYKIQTPGNYPEENIQQEINDLYSSPSTVYRIGGKNMLYHKLPVKEELLFYNPVFSM